jgi:hypothetical protein
MTTLTAENAIARSEEYDEIVTIEGSKEAHEFLLDECSDNVEHHVDHEDGYTLTEYWKNDPDSADGMLWRVHVRDNDPTESDVIVETMPDHLRAAHRAAGNWGQYPANGAQRSQVPRDEAEEIVEADADGYDHIVE